LEENLFGLLCHYQVMALGRPDQKQAKKQQGYDDPCCVDNDDGVVGCGNHFAYRFQKNNQLILYDLFLKQRSSFVKYFCMFLQNT